MEAPFVPTKENILQMFPVFIKRILLTDIRKLPLLITWKPAIKLARRVRKAQHTF